MLNEKGLEDFNFKVFNEDQAITDFAYNPQNNLLAVSSSNSLKFIELNTDFTDPKTSCHYFKSALSSG